MARLAASYKFELSAIAGLAFRTKRGLLSDRYNPARMSRHPPMAMGVMLSPNTSEAVHSETSGVR